jgi:hypothetical protein
MTPGRGRYTDLGALRKLYLPVVGHPAWGEPRTLGAGSRLGQIHRFCTLSPPLPTKLNSAKFGYGSELT